METIQMKCSNCGRNLRTKAEHLGKKMKCPKCGTVQVVAKESSRVAAADVEVFLSYSNKDKATADAACALLEQESLRCWIAPRDIVPGLEWGASIIGGLKRAKCLVLIFSSNSNSSSQVRREVERAANRGIPIIPFRVEDVVPSDAMEYFISSHHWMDALTPPLKQHLLALANRIKQLLAIEQPQRTVPVQQPEPTQEILEPHKFAFSAGYYGQLALVGCDPNITSFPTEWVHAQYRYACENLSMRPDLLNFLKTKKQVMADERDAVFNTQIANVFANTIHGNLSAQTALGYAAMMLGMVLEYEGTRPNAHEYREPAVNLASQILVFAHQSQVPTDIYNKLRKLQETHSGTTDPATCLSLKRDLDEVTAPYRVVNPNSPAIG